MTISRRGLLRLGAGAAVAGAIGVAAAEVTEPVAPVDSARVPAPIPVRSGRRWTGDPVDIDTIKSAMALHAAGFITQEEANHRMNACYCGEMG